MKPRNSDMLRASAQGGAAILKPGAALERSRIIGIYHAVCTGPLEKFVEAYGKVRDAIWEIERRGPMARFWNRKLLQQLREKLAGFEVERKWADDAPNLVTTVGMNLILDQALAGSSYSVTGPYMGLITDSAWTGVDAGDTMGSHGGWREAGATYDPHYSGSRKTMAWSSASGGAKALSSALSFSITSAGTLKGCFMVLGSGASATVDNGSGTLGSAGTFTGGDQPVVNTNTVSVSYTITLT